MSLLRYSILAAGVAAAALALAWALLLRRAEAPVRGAVAFGVAIAVANTVAAHALVLWSSGRSAKAFLGAFLGGMFGRLALMLAAVVAGVVGLGLPRLPLLAALLPCYVLFLVVELSIVHKHAGTSLPGGASR